MVPNINREKIRMIELNSKQIEAAKFLHGIAAVIATPGSGKTLTMSARIGMLVKTYGIAPESILGLTFTRSAAQTMKDRLLPVLDELAARVTLSTIHSFCHQLLRNEGRAFEILSGKDQIAFLRKIMQKMKEKAIPTGMVIREVSLAKNNLITVSEFRDIYDGDESMQRVCDIFEAYEKEKQKKMFLDFDDLLVEAHLLLRDREDVREKYQATFRHVLVDEFQDTNPAQMEVLKLLIGNGNGNGTSFWVCGDDAQAIFAFTGASVGNILNFKRLFPDAAEYIMNINYRSTPQILRACENLIRHNSRRIEKGIEAVNPDGNKVVLLEAVNEEDEARLIANEILDLTERKGSRYSDIAILYRANFQSRVVEETLSQCRIPFHVENGQNFYQRREVKSLLDYLRLLNNPDSEEGDEALKSVINIPNRYMGRKFVGELEEFASNKGVHLYRGLESMPVELPYLKRNAKEFIGLIHSLMVEVKGMEPSELIRVLRESLDYDRIITDDDIPSPDDSKIANINQLQMVSARYRDIPSLLNFADSFRDASANDKDGVSLMTIHKSKGLEFPAVFVIGMVDGVLPNKNGDIEEERRIAFVALSRAMKELFLTYSRTHSGKAIKKSPFIEEILGGEH